MKVDGRRGDLLDFCFCVFLIEMGAFVIFFFIFATRLGDGFCCGLC